MLSEAKSKVEEAQAKAEEAQAWAEEAQAKAAEAQAKAAEAKAEGRAEGERRTQIETAKRMLEDDFSTELIAKFTGLSIDEIENLKAASAK